MSCGSRLKLGHRFQHDTSTLCLHSHDTDPSQAQNEMNEPVDTHESNCGKSLLDKLHEQRSVLLVENKREVFAWRRLSKNFPQLFCNRHTAHIFKLEAQHCDVGDTDTYLIFQRCSL